METMIQAWGISQAIAQPRLVSGPGAQPSHWPRLTTIPRQV